MPSTKAALKLQVLPDSISQIGQLIGLVFFLLFISILSTKRICLDIFSLRSLYLLLRSLPARPAGGREISLKRLHAKVAKIFYAKAAKNLFKV